jgi:RimJ/RimL family protein N-acetyltransferase
MKCPPFLFVDTPRVLTLVDHELELVEPEERYIGDLLAACHHPRTKKEMPGQARTTRDGLALFVQQNPRGHTPGDEGRGIAPGYTFWMRVRAGVAGLGENGWGPLEVGIAGSISLRIGHSANLDLYLGHIGYHVLPPARGRHFALRACRLLLPLARLHGHTNLWITCNPENVASRKTCEELGAVFVNTVAIPRDNALYSQGDRQKCRYRLDL